MTTDTYVYLAWGEHGDLLYVGITDDPSARERWHRKHSAWFVWAERIDYSKPYSRRDALKLEDAAIWEFGPVYNRPQARDFAEFGLDWRDEITPVVEDPDLPELPIEVYKTTPLWRQMEDALTKLGRVLIDGESVESVRAS